MCGIVGLRNTRLGSDGLLEVCRSMTDAIAHRGPNTSDHHLEANELLAFGHRRLSIIDLSPAGAQPMISHDGRYVLVYNGEIYDFEKMRQSPELANRSWRGHSDTEVILESIASLGLETTLLRINGMYAFALWDRHERTLSLVRDPLGIKPLFYSSGANGWAFASELKALKAADDTNEIDPAAVGSFLRYGYVPGPQSIYKNIKKVAPGQIIRIRADGALDKTTFHSLPDLAINGAKSPLELDDESAADQLEALLMDAVSSQMVADVDVGAFLSGGIDSSTVAAMMVRGNKGNVRTYSIGFPDFGYDESKAAAEIARHLGTKHQSIVLSGQDALDVVPVLPDLFDEPFGDSSQIPTYLLARMTRDHVTVALSGDGGDELFGGYNRYLWATQHWPKLSRSPLGVRRLASGILNCIPESLIASVERVTPGLPPQTASKIRKFSQVMGLAEEDVYRVLTSQIQSPGDFAIDAGHVHELEFPWAFGLLNKMRLADCMTYMPDDVLQKVDRCSMAVSLEARPVLLDRRLLEFAWSLPESMLIRGRETKWLLRQVLRRHVPNHLFDRPKMGFGIPLAAWLRGPLKDWARDLINDPTFGGGYLKKAPAETLFRDHLNGKADHSHALWNIFSFAAWHRRWA